MDSSTTSQRKTNKTIRRVSDVLVKEMGEVTEPDELVEINKLYDAEKKFWRVGDKSAAMIMDHHQKELMQAYMKEHNCVLTLDTRSNRVVIWDGEFH